VPGTVTQVELNPINDGVQSSTAGGTAAPMYRASVALSTNSLTMYGERHAFEPGLTLEADIFNDRRRLIAWVFDPLVSAARDRAR
jgi:membrane fusion protein